MKTKTSIAMNEETNHWQDITIDDVIQTFFISDVSKTLGEANSHSYIVDQHTNFQLTQLGFYFGVDWVSICEVYCNCLDVNRSKFAFCIRTETQFIGNIEKWNVAVLVLYSWLLTYFTGNFIKFCLCPTDQHHIQTFCSQL